MREAEMLLETVSRIYETALEDDAVTTWLDMLRDSIGAEHAVLSERIDADLVSHCSELDDSLLPLVRRLAATTMYDPSLSQMPTRTTRRMSDYLPLRELIRSEVYQELLRPLQGGHALAFTWSRKDGRTAIGICRDSTRDRDFSDAELLTIQPLLLHFHHALRIRAQFSALKTNLRQSWAALDLIQDGVIIVDRWCKVRYLNEAARSILEDRDVLLADHRGLRAVTANNDRRLQAAFRAAARVTQPVRCKQPSDVCNLFDSTRTTVVIERTPPKRPLLAAAAPAAGIAAPLGCDEFSDAIVVMLRDPDREPAGNVDVTMKIFGLTRREAELALALKRGQSLPVCALMLGISEGTARQYLKSIFSKTGVQRQAELVRLLLLGLR